MKLFAIGLGLVLFSACSLIAQQSASSQHSEGTQTKGPEFRLNTQEVTLDMVFRDKKGKTIRDIRPEEIHVIDNGVEQHVNSFRFLEGSNAGANEAAAPTAGAPPALDPVKELRLVTLVFKDLDLDGKRFFRQALQDILNAAPEQNLYFSVMVIDERLNMIQSFTNDRSALLKSVDKSTMWSFPQYLHNTDVIKAELRKTLSQGEPDSQSGFSGDTATPPTLTGGTNSGPSAGAIQGSVGWRMAKMQYDMLQEADASDRDVSAHGTIDALLALIKAQGQLPGRKVVVYFDPDLLINETVKEQYNYMIGAANRANVTFYTVDPKGLVTWSQGDAGRDQLGGAAGESRRLDLTGGTEKVTPLQAESNENAENGIRANSLMWLTDLAQKTGGTAIGDTNDVKAPLRAVMEDVRSYYEATYDPHISVYDGKFHPISVKVDRPGIVVHTRSGYYALPQLRGGQQVVAYEVPLLNGLTSAQPASDLSFDVAAERFSERGPKIEYMLTLEAPLKELTFASQPGGKSAILDVPMLILVRNSAGEVVEKFSKEFSVEVPQDTVEARKQAALIQTYRTELAPGTYTLEAAVMDRKGNKLGVKKTPLTVPAPSSKLAVSDVVIIRRTDKLSDSQMLNPFYFPGGKVVPTLSNTLKGGPGNILPFYFSVYPDPAIKDAPKMTMAFYKNGQYLGSAGAPLPSPEQDGRIPYIADLPADKFTPGSYEIRLGITQGVATAEQKVDFDVQ